MLVRVLGTSAAALLLAATLALGGCGGDSEGGITLGDQVSIRVDPLEVSFGIVAIGETSSEIVTIENDGAGTLKLDPPRLSDRTSADYAFTGPDTFELEPGETTMITVVYSPSDNQLDQGELIIGHNASGRDAVRVNITALAQVARLEFEPDPVQFGEIRAGGTVDKQIRLHNGGADTATLTALVWSENSSPDYHLMDEPEFPYPLSPGEDLLFTIRYAPVGGNVDTAELAVQYTDTQNVEDVASVRVLGQEVVADIEVSPGYVDFGWVALEERYTLPVTMTNVGTDLLQVQSIGLDPDHDAVALDGQPEEATDLEPGASIGFKVHFETSEAFPLTTDPIAAIRVLSNDPDEGNLEVPIYAKIEAPAIVVTPTENINFGVVAQSFTSQPKDVTIRNIGYAPLELSEILVIADVGAAEGEFAATSAEPLAALDGTGTTYLQPNEAVVVSVTFTNDGASSGEAWGKLVVRSNDQTNQEIEVLMQALRGGSPTCEIILEPGILEFGIVPHGANKIMSMNIRNIGSGNCSFRQARIAECSQSMFPGFPASCNPSSTSSEFRVISAPIPVANGLPPGAVATLQIMYEPPDSAPMLFEFDDYAALLQIQIHNPYAPPGNDGLTWIPAEQTDPTMGTNSNTPNLLGSSGISRISVLPDHIDFGLVTLGCFSDTHQVSVYNSGTAPLNITAIEPSAECTSEFVINAPPIPPDGIDVTTAQPLVIDVKYHAQNIGEQSCSLIIRSSDQSAPVLSVPMQGAGTLESHQIDIFQQGAGQEVDILFVVDDSGSMCEEQDRLATNLQAFINHAQTWENDYQIGVVSTCVQDEDTCEGAGLLKSKFYPPERWVDTSTWPHFAENVDIGCDGGSDSQEAGLEAAHMALSLPHSHLTATPCTAPADCQAPDQCLPLGDGTGVCGGFNGGFLRDDAALEIVILSDEDDQSPATPNFYVDFFRSIKGFANENFIHVHSIVGDKDTGCGDPESTSGETSAGAGDRYIYVSEQTGGIVESICNDSFADALSEIGAIAFGLKVQFFLSRAGDPATIEVRVNDVVCTEGWLYDAPSNSIIFEDGGPCMPQEGQEIQIEYDAICFTS